MYRMKITVIFFGQLEQLANCKRMDFEGISDTEELKTKVVQEFPKLVGFDYLIALNQEIIQEKMVLSDQDELALLPPFAGG